MSFFSMANAEEKKIFINEFSLLNGIPEGSQLNEQAKDCILEVLLYQGDYIILSDDDALKQLENKENNIIPHSSNNDSNIKEMAEKLNCDQILYGSISCENEVYFISSKLFDCRAGKLIKVKTVEVSDKTLLRDAFKDLARYHAYNAVFDDTRYVKKLKKNNSDSEYEKFENKQKEYQDLTISEQRINGLKAVGLSALVPGLGQTLYGGDFGRLEGAIFFGGTFALSYFTYYKYKEKEDAKDEYDKLGRHSSESEFDKKWEAAESANKTYNYFMISLVSVYMLNIMDAYFSGSRVDRIEKTGSDGLLITQGFNFTFYTDLKQSIIDFAYTFRF